MNIDELPSEDEFGFPIQYRFFEGHTVEQEITLECSQCGKKLLQLALWADPTKHFRVRAVCPCGDKSYIQDIKGGMSYTEILRIKDIEFDEKENITFYMGD